MKSEIHDWKQSLGDMADENILMKTRLSHMLKENFDNSLLLQVEDFHSRLLTQEEFINLIRHNIGELDDFIETQRSRQFNKSTFDNLRSTLKSQIMTAGIRFAKLKSEFNEFFQDRGLRFTHNT